MESNNSPEIPGWGVTSQIPSLPSGHQQTGHRSSTSNWPCLKTPINRQRSAHSSHQVAGISPSEMGGGMSTSLKTHRQLPSNHQEYCWCVRNNQTTQTYVQTSYFYKRTNGASTLLYYLHTSSVYVYYYSVIIFNQLLSRNLHLSSKLQQTDLNNKKIKLICVLHKENYQRACSMSWLYSLLYVKTSCRTAN